MTDLERFFDHIVHTLASQDPAAVHGPLSLGDLYRRIVPYRASRRALDLDSSEDYELLLLRLAAGESGLARTEPAEARDRLAQEIQSPNPDLRLIYQFDDATVHLVRGAVARVLGASREQAYAPPAPVAEAPSPLDDSIETDEAVGTVQEAGGEEPIAAAEAYRAPEVDAGGCAFCGEALPTDRTVNFCPHCGQSQFVNRCPECRSDVEQGWRYCVICGYPVGDR